MGETNPQEKCRAEPSVVAIKELITMYKLIPHNKKAEVREEIRKALAIPETLK